MLTAPFLASAVNLCEKSVESQQPNNPEHDCDDTDVLSQPRPTNRRRYKLDSTKNEDFQEVDLIAEMFVAGYVNADKLEASGAPYGFYNLALALATTTEDFFDRILV